MVPKIYIFIAERRGYTDLKQQAQLALKQAHIAKGGYKPKISNNIFNNFEPLDLFWGYNLPEKIHW